MASRYPEHDIFPKEGMDLRDPSGLEWFANVWRPERARSVAVRPGFGQLTQQDCASQKAAVSGATPATGGYRKHLGSFLYNSNFGHRQIISVFEALVQYSGSDDPGVGTAPSYWERSLKTTHGAAKTAVVSIYDITTGEQWEKVLIVHTSENCRNVDIPEAHGHFETQPVGPAGVPHDFIKFHYHDGVENAAFKQIGDSVVMMLGPYGVWVYHGIDVAKLRQPIFDSSNISLNLFAGAGFTVGTNYPTGHCEGSVFQPVTGVRGLNGEQFTYFTKSEFPRADASALVQGRMVYALRGVLYFSDVGQPGAIMADNIAEIQSEGKIQALAEHNGQLYAFTETETHLLQVQQSLRAGEARANVVSVSHVRISRRTGCVGSRSVVETPFGVCWVSSRGCHLAGGQQAVEDLSDPIQSYWDEGIVNPTTHYYEANGGGGAKTQPEVIYKHQGRPTMAYDPESESLLVAYPSHILVYQFRHKSWSIWPLATTQPPGTAPIAPQSRQTIEALQVLSDSQGTYLVGGLHDHTEDGLSPANQSPSYYITELGRGGALDRSCKDEDERRYGWGRYTYAIDPSASLNINNGYCYTVGKPQSIFKSEDGTKMIYEFPVFLEAIQPATWPPQFSGLNLASLRFDLSWNAAFTFEGLGITPESSPKAAWTVTSAANNFTSSREFLTSATNQITSYKMPLFVFRLSAPIGTSARTDFVVNTAQVVNSAGGVWDIVRVLLWQQQHLYASATTSLNNRLASSVEWGIKTGQIGLNEGKVLRVRGINAVMETVTSQSSHLYNSFTVSDYKRLSGQYPDYTNLTPGNRRQQQTDLLRQRMTNGRRVFNSTARWAPVAAGNVADQYLIDSPELNSVVTSVSAKGEHVSVGMYGYATDKADALSMCRMSIAVLNTGNRRRKGR